MPAPVGSKGPGQDTIPAWAFQLQSHIDYQDKELAEIKKLAEEMNRALRGDNGNVGIVGRVDSLEKFSKNATAIVTALAISTIGLLITIIVQHVLTP